MRVLLAENDRVMRKSIEASLMSLGCAVDAFAEAGTAAVACQRQHYPVALLGGGFRGMDALELCRRIRATERGTRTVILLVTERTEPPNLRQMYGAGADDCIEKPASATALAPRLLAAKRLLRERQRGERAEQAANEARGELATVLRRQVMTQAAAALAHEITQPLTTIRNYAGACCLRLESAGARASGLHTGLARIATEAERAGEVVQRIRGFIRGAKPTQECTDLNDLVREVVCLAQPSAKEHKIPIRLRLSRAIPQVRVDRVQLQQVVLNLVQNGLEAMGGTAATKRELCVRTGNARRTAVQVAVRDTGQGLEAPVNRLFEPFYTTKSHGLGMGLSISRSIVEAHGGRLWATSDPARGTTFRFTLPVARAA